MNEDKNEAIKNEIQNAIAAGITPDPQPEVSSTPKTPPPRDLMQHVVEGMLPDELRKNLNGVNAAEAAASLPITPLTETQKLDPKFLQKPLRTYESDLADAMGKQKTSVASIAIAESKKKEEETRQALETAQQEETAPKARMSFAFLKPVLFVILGIAFIGGGIGGGYYLYRNSAFAKPSPKPAAIVVTSLIPSNRKIAIAIDAEQSGSKFVAPIYTALNKERGTPGEMIEIVLFKSILDPKEGKNNTIPITATEFIEGIDVDMPDTIKRSTVDRFMVGAYLEETGDKTVFLALTTDFFQNVFAGMLSWEDTMADDLATLFKYPVVAPLPEIAIEIATTTATTTTSTPPIQNTRPHVSYFNIQGSWSDKVIRNRDVREFRNVNGELLLLYSFINKETLIITTTQSAFIAAIDRIEKQTYIR